MTSNLLHPVRLLPGRAARAGEAARRVLRARAHRRAHLPHARPRLARAPDLQGFGRRPAARDALDRVRASRRCSSISSACSRSTRCSASRAMLPLNPAELGAVSRRLVLEHRGELRHQHQLAGLRRRVDDELSHADARRSRCRTSSPPRPASRCSRRSIARLRAQADRHDRQLLGRSHALDALHPAAALVRPGARAGEPGRGADLRPVRQGADRREDRLRGGQEGRRRQAGDGQGWQAGDGEEDHAGADPAARPGGFADRGQAARHQRRRLLQRQLGAPVRERRRRSRTSSRCSRSC